MKEFVLSQNTNEKPLPFDLNELNAAQREAVLAGKGHYLVIAGAGSGKTKTLVYRVARLVFEGVPPHAILLLTFTRKSSQEMLRRASGLLDHRCQQVSGGTFHGFANLILRKYHSALGYPSNFTIMDRGDSEDFVSRIRKNLGFSAADKRFPRKGTILTVLSKAQNTGDQIEWILDREFPHFAVYADEIKQIQAAYALSKKEMSVMDYDDLLIQLKLLLETQPEICQEISEGYRYIMVDEYQDTNQLQSAILKQLASVHQNVMVVGDDSQSIYSFRGAHFKNIMAFPDEFHNAHKIVLEENYRSKQPILDLTNKLIEKAKEKYSKNLFTSQKGGDLPAYIEASTENDQSRFIAQKVLQLREEGVSLNNMAVLFRSSSHTNDLEIELQSMNIPYVKYGGFKFVETAHIKDMIAYLRVIFNYTDGLSWQRILLLLEGIGPKAADAIYQYIVIMKGDWGAISADQWSGKKFHLDLLGLFHLIRSAQFLSPSEMAEAVSNYYAPFLKQKYDDYHKREGDIGSLIGIAERYEQLEKFLTELSLEPPEGATDSEEASNEEEKLVLSTIHSAKGLEWHSVFVMSLLDGYLPSFRSLGDESQIEEERRLLYVAMTRAKENLFLIKPHIEVTQYGSGNYGNMYFSKWSRFLSEDNLLPDLAERWVLSEGQAKSPASEEGEPPRPNYYF